MVTLLSKSRGRALHYTGMVKLNSHLHNSQAKGKYPVQPLNTANSLHCNTAQLHTCIPLNTLSFHIFIQLSPSIKTKTYTIKHFKQEQNIFAW